MNNRIVSLIILCLVVSIPLVIALLFSVETMLRFVFFWPFFMSVLWMAGGLLFWFSRERHWSWGREDDVPTLKGKPLVSVIVPCYNEENNVAG